MIRIRREELWAQWSSLAIKVKMGVVLVIVANLLIGSLVVVPFLDVDLKTKAIVSTIIFVVGEICFYAGLFLLGKEIVAKYRRFFSLTYWRNRNNKTDTDKEKDQA